MAWGEKDGILDIKQETCKALKYEKEKLRCGPQAN